MGTFGYYWGTSSTAIYNNRAWDEVQKEARASVRERELTKEVLELKKKLSKRERELKRARHFLHTRKKTKNYFTY